MNREEQEIKDITLRQFRKKNMLELQQNLNTLKKVRDVPDDDKCPHCKGLINFSTVGRDKNRIEATKAIARHLGGLQPERVGSKDDEAPAPDITKPLSHAERNKIDELLGGTKVN